MVANAKVSPQIEAVTDVLNGYLMANDIGKAKIVGFVLGLMAGAEKSNADNAENEGEKGR